MKKIIVAFFIFSAFQSVAQDGVGLRSGITVEKKITKKFSVGVTAQARFNGDISYLQTYLFEAGAGYKLPLGFDISAYYRNANRRKDETKEYKMRHRFYVDLGYGKKLGFVKLENRLRYQHQYKDNDGVTEFDASYFRDKIEVSFPNKSKFTPYISNDFFINTSTGFDQIRPKVGVGYKFNKKHALDLGAFKDFDVVGTEKYSPVLVVNYKFKF
ncbi:MAG: DUF2490 domain-containing protein [Cytophagaceae bacterium]|nr:DUF2490 domain-containing protein [Cytophagaceae bacterium]MBK9933812.1 DUF2490 domain-containing protein [Cytophagaceae bacterium]MBL0302470.1 DUF2490 domain-containing protein [Cytophagaceae bacterium]MBL0325297.1 DUF2490 domain-containing protein [Cytophagaceae bacterium]